MLSFPVFIEIFLTKRKVLQLRLSFTLSWFVDASGPLTSFLERHPIKYYMGKNDECKIETFLLANHGEFFYSGYHYLHFIG